MNRFTLFWTLLIAPFILSNPASSQEIPFDPASVTAVEPVEENGRPLLRLDFDPRLPIHFLADGALTYGMFRLSPTQDKAKHFIAGYVISNASTGLLHLYLPDDMKHRKLVAGLIGFGAGALVGVAKEVLDARGFGTPDPADALATAAGAGMGAITLNLTFSLNFNKTKKRRRSL